MTIRKFCKSKTIIHSDIVSGTFNNTRKLCKFKYYCKKFSLNIWQNPSLHCILQYINIFNMSIVQGVSKKSMQYLKVDLQLAPMNELAFDWLKLFSFVGDQCICSNFIIYSSSHTFAQTSIPPSMGYFFHKFQKLLKFNEASKILYFTAFYFISVRNKFMEFFMKSNSARKRSRKMFCIWFCKQVPLL